MNADIPGQNSTDPGTSAAAINNEVNFIAGPGGLGAVRIGDPTVSGHEVFWTVPLGLKDRAEKPIQDRIAHANREMLKRKDAKTEEQP